MEKVRSCLVDWTRWCKRKGARPRPGRAPELRMRQTLRMNGALLRVSTAAALTGADTSPLLCSNRGSKDPTSVVISKPVVAIAARPETMDLTRGDISVLMIVLLKVVLRCGSDPEQRGAVVLSFT